MGVEKGAPLRKRGDSLGAAASAGTPMQASPQNASLRRVDTVLSQAVLVLTNVMDGYEVPQEMIDEALLDRDMAFTDGSLPLLEFDDVMATIGDKLPITVSEALYGLMEAHADTPRTDAARAGNSAESAEGTAVAVAVPHKDVCMIA